jgi:hypothetical protein
LALLQIFFKKNAYILILKFKTLCQMWWGVGGRGRDRMVFEFKFASLNTHFYQWIATFGGRFPGITISFNNRTDRHDMTEFF